MSDWEIFRKAIIGIMQIIGIIYIMGVLAKI